MNKERQSVYEKALVICHEDEKELSVVQQKLENNKLQRYIDYKLEERKLRTELVQLKREQMHIAKEAKQREKERKTVDDIAKELTKRNRVKNGHTAAQVQKKFSLPQVNCTQTNVPRILRRSLSYESEYFTWTFGLPRIENASSKPQGKNADLSQAKQNGEDKSEEDEGDETKAQQKASVKTCDIVYSVPVTEPMFRKRTLSDSQGGKLPPIEGHTSTNHDTHEQPRKVNRLKLPDIP